MVQPVSYASVQQYMDYLQQQMIHASLNDGSEKAACVKFSEQQRVDREILRSRQLRRRP